MLVLCLEIYLMVSIYEMFLSKFSEVMLTHNQEAKIKGILYFNFSRLAIMLRLCLRNHKTEPLYAYRRYAYKKKTCNLDDLLAFIMIESLLSNF